MFDPKIARRILDMFVKQLPQSIDTLREKVAQQDPGETARLAHAIKGAAANVSADRVRDIAFRIEELGKKDELDAALKLIPEMESVFRECCEFISTSLPNLDEASARLKPNVPARPKL